MSSNFLILDHPLFAAQSSVSSTFSLYYNLHVIHSFINIVYATLLDTSSTDLEDILASPTALVPQKLVRHYCMFTATLLTTVTGAHIH